MASAITVENLGKSYRVNHETSAKGYRTLRESLVDVATAPVRRLRGNRDRVGEVEEFWALKGVSFEVRAGEVVGIIGRNGAGKSTLLKILSRITKPTTGQVRLNGRVGSLLEVGTGFHPELTGRENIYLNGSVLGMSRREIERRFDEIVAFAEVAKFLDTPVKRYSSGMYVRLAFSVAAHLEPEILIIDEVLAVGDAVFQRRCLDRMTELARNGRSLVFVSHQLDLIPRFCSTAILLDQGCVVERGDVDRTIDHYRRKLLANLAGSQLEDRPRTGHGKARFVNITFLDDAGVSLAGISAGEDLRCIVEIESSYSCDEVSLSVILKTVNGARLLTSWTDENSFPFRLTPGIHRVECRFCDIPLRPGRRILFDLWMHDGDVVDYIEEACVLDVVDSAATSGVVSSRADQGNALCRVEWRRLD